MLVQHLGTDTGSSSPHRGEKEHTAYVHVPLMAGTEASPGLEIPAFKDNPTSHVQAEGSANMLFTQTG